MLWDVARDERIWERILPFQSRVARNPDGSRLLISGVDHSLTLLDANGKELRVLQRETGGRGKGDPYTAVTQRALAFVPPDHKRAVTGDAQGDLTLWDLEDGKILAKWGRGAAEVGDGVGKITFSAHGKLALAAGAGRTLQLWEVDTGKLVRTLTAGPMDDTGR